MSNVKIRNNQIHSVKIILYRRTNTGYEYLLIKEPEGIYGFVGGAEDEIDLTIEETAKREICEEVGLSFKSVDLKKTEFTHTFIHSDQTSPRFGKTGILHVYIGKYNEKEKIKLEPELKEYVWKEEEEVKNALKTSYKYLPSIFKKATELLKKSRPV